MHRKSLLFAHVFLFATAAAAQTSNLTRVRELEAFIERTTALMMVPGDKFALALATNLENAQLKPFADRIMEIFLGN